MIGAQKDECVYPIGIDWIWTYSDLNKLTFLNGYKMKGALLIGITHMTFGMFLKVINNIYFGDILHLIFETIPQILFYISFFGLMGFALVYKWTFNYINVVRCYPHDTEVSAYPTTTADCNAQNGLTNTPNIIAGFATPWQTPDQFRNIFFDQQ